jgi:hypothetical protein
MIIDFYFFSDVSESILQPNMLQLAALRQHTDIAILPGN